MLLLLTCWVMPLRADTILILGDSLSASYGMNEDIGWVNLLRAKMPEHKIINAAVSGETSAGGLRRLPALLDSDKPQLVFVELGANDGLRGFPIEQLKNNLTKIITLAKESGARVLLSEVMVPPNYGPRYAKAFNQVFQTLAKEQNVPLVPFFMTDIAPHPELMQADGLHPNEAAQEQISDFMLPWLTPSSAKGSAVPATGSH
ncbi:arylesterase [Shewanella cyperi]|uniref:Arylesterase n=1 Tax=Shewanella cyperi TaxID=2814292 RepID=A0A974XI17_9GAMM|nr:arylesterase [Shewanella cyperi]QSX28790.1 arylesterase [Shewanella cyperi]